MAESKRVLITGIKGFVGSHLAELLLSKGYEVYGTQRRRSKEGNILHIKHKLNLIEADITDHGSVKRAIDKSKPEVIFHLAAQSYVPASWDYPEETLMNNIRGNLSILEVIRENGMDPVIQIAGSSEEYGKVTEDELPITEKNELRALSPYGVSKIAQDRLSVQYHESFGIKTIVTRAFNHTGPRRGEEFVTSTFAKQIAEIESGKKEPVLYVGNLEAMRDFTDVRDVVKAYLLATEKCKYGEVYNICSERSWKIQEVLEVLLSLSDKKIEVKQDPDRMRPSDLPVLLGDSTKFREATGWQPTIPFEQTLEDLLNYWRESLNT